MEIFSVSRAGAVPEAPETGFAFMHCTPFVMPLLPLCLDRQRAERGAAAPAPHHGEMEEIEDAILCAFCFLPVTREAERITVLGRHRHRRTNPAGIDFRIGCFQRAPGCRAIGSPTSEHTWFPAHVWQVALCADCHTHLGWRFTSAGGASFFGLILAHLVARGPILGGHRP